MFWHGHRPEVSLTMTRKEAQSISGAGQQYANVVALARQPHIARQLNKLDPHHVRTELRETGGWDAEQLQDAEENKLNILWLAACDLRERRATA